MIRGNELNRLMTAYKIDSIEFELQPNGRFYITVRKKNKYISIMDNTLAHLGLSEFDLARVNIAFKQCDALFKEKYVNTYDI